MSIKNITRAAAILLALLFNTALAQTYDDGVSALNEGDYETAIEVYRSLAEEGNRAAQFSLAFMYDNGMGVPQDTSEAMRWYRAAAEQGVADAQYKLGVMHAKGAGVIQDYITAHMWFNIASANGYEKAREKQAIMAEQMSREAIEEAQSRARTCMESKYQDCD